MPGFWMDMAVQPNHYLLFLKCWEICFESSFYFDLKIQYLKIKTPILSFDMILTLDRISDYLDTQIIDLFSLILIWKQSNGRLKGRSKKSHKKCCPLPNLPWSTLPRLAFLFLKDDNPLFLAPAGALVFILPIAYLQQSLFSNLSDLVQSCLSNILLSLFTAKRGMHWVCMLPRWWIYRGQEITLRAEGNLEV